MTWKVYALCKYGWFEPASFGDLWIVRKSYPVCPKCGESGYDYQEVIGRVVCQGWFKPDKLEIKPGPLSQEIRALQDTGKE